MGREDAMELSAQAMPTSTPPPRTMERGPKRSTSQPSIGTSHVSVMTKMLNATWIAARPQWYLLSMGFTNSVQPYCRFATIAMHTMPRDSCSQRLEGCDSRAADAMKTPPKLQSVVNAMSCCGARTAGCAIAREKTHAGRLYFLNSNGSRVRRRMALTFIKTLAMAAGIAAAAAPCASPAQSSDADFLAAKEAAQRGQWSRLETYRARLAGHVLEAYPAYWLLAGNVERADPKDVQAFLARYPGSPLAESLRRDFLKALGAAQSWELFRAEYSRIAGDDVEVTCYSFQERLARGDAEAGAEAHALFVSGRDGAPSCDTVFAALAADGRITEAEMWARFRLLAASGNLREAKRLAALLPAKRAPNDKTIDRIARDPVRYLAHEKVRALDRAGQALVAFAIARLARGKPEDAAQHIADWAPKLAADAVAFSWGQVAWQGALPHQPSALDWYARAKSTKLDDTQIAWRARAALRSGDWKQVLDAIQALSPQAAREPTWRYWRARAQRALGDAAGADALLRTLATENHFYGLLAQEEIGAAKAPDWNDGWRPGAADLERVRAFEGIQRALELYRLGLENEATREWLWAIRGFDDRDLLTAAEIARQARIADRAI